jgi:hypothetical protein
MIAGGLRWTPPDPEQRPRAFVAPAIVVKTSAAADEVPRLVEADMDAFEDLLRHLTIERCDIEGAMAFALDHAVGRCTLTPPDPQLKSAWFQTLHPSREKTGSKVCLSNATCTATTR